MGKHTHEHPDQVHLFEGESAAERRRRLEKERDEKLKSEAEHSSQPSPERKPRDIKMEQAGDDTTKPEPQPERVPSRRTAFYEKLEVAREKARKAQKKKPDEEL